MKKGRILGVLLAAAMAFGGVTGAVGTRSVKADDSSKYKFDKQYLLKAGDSETAESPAETFSFGKKEKQNFTRYRIQNLIPLMKMEKVIQSMQVMLWKRVFLKR